MMKLNTRIKQNNYLFHFLMASDVRKSKPKSLMIRVVYPFPVYTFVPTSVITKMEYTGFRIETRELAIGELCLESAGDMGGLHPGTHHIDPSRNVGHRLTTRGQGCQIKTNDYLSWQRRRQPKHFYVFVQNYYLTILPTPC